jgi:hypothetical protein
MELDDDFIAMVCGSYTYVWARGQTYITTEFRGKPKAITIANFTAEIEEECKYTDGADSCLYYIISGKLHNGSPLPTIRVRADAFSSLEWVSTEWGARAVIYPVARAREHLRTAILALSQPKRTVMFGHVGWVRHNGLWFYLSNGGAIGPNGATQTIRVDLRHPILQRVELPAPSPQPIEALLEVLSLIDIAPEEVTLPLLGATFLAPLGPVLNLDFSLFLGFQTGVYKSALAAVFQAAYGRQFHGKNLISWDGTGNALQVLTHHSKDCVTVVDDYLPQGGASEAQSKQRDAERLLRSAANKAGRTRMGPENGLAPVYVPQGLIINTGEGLPAMRSLRARMVTLELKQGDVNLSRLSQAQKAAADGVFAGIMADYIRSVARKIEQVNGRIQGFREELRKIYARPGQHPQTASHIAALNVGLDFFNSYLGSRGIRHAITPWRIEEVLQRVADRQIAYIDSND